jgi:hypothetical protein
MATVTSSPQGQRASQHYNECLYNAKLNSIQLANNVREYAKAKPQLHAQPVQFALMEYLIALCGLPNQG